MRCSKCKKELKQISGLWSPKTPNNSFRKYICHNCKLGFTEVVDVLSHTVVRVDVSDLSVKSERQSTLFDF